jgi:hypothetical protein
MLVADLTNEQRASLVRKLDEMVQGRATPGGAEGKDSACPRGNTWVCAAVPRRS